MNDKKPSTEILRRVHIDQHYIEVGEWPDEPSCIELRVAGAGNISYFGQLNLTLTPAAAFELGKALMRAATEKGAVDHG